MMMLSSLHTDTLLRSRKRDNQILILMLDAIGLDPHEMIDSIG